MNSTTKIVTTVEEFAIYYATKAGFPESCVKGDTIIVPETKVKLKAIKCVNCDYLECEGFRVIIEPVGRPL